MWLFGLDKESQRLKKEAWDNEVRISKEEADKCLLELVTKMTSSYCPLVKDNCKGTGCIHFNGGVARVDTILRDRPRPDVWRPRCKLWRS